MITPSYKFSACVFGGINIDFISSVKSMPKAGETIVGEDFVVTPGGKGANQAVACSRLGLKTSMIGRVGNDTFADQLLSNLNDEKINTDGITKDKTTHTGIATIILDETGQNSIIQTPGANYLCGHDELNYLKSKILEFDLLVLQSEIPVNISLNAAEIAKKAQKLVIWDPAPANKIPDEAYEYIDYFIPNQTEAQTLSGLEDVLNEKQAMEASKIFLDKGVKSVIITMAEQGAFGYNGTESYFIDIPEDIKVIDSVAAGDAFSGGLSLGISEELEFKKLIIYGVLSGCIAVQKPGATDSMPTIKEFNSLQVKTVK